MKKNIILTNGEIRMMECDENFLKMYKGLAVKVYKNFKKGTALTEDEHQELDIVIFEAFLEYNGSSQFATFLIWKVKGYCSRVIARAKAQKRDSSEFEIIDLDFKLSSDKGDAESSIHEVIADKNIDIERHLMDQAFIGYIRSNLNELELDILAVNLKLKTLAEVGRAHGKSVSNVGNHNIRFKKKLKKLIEEYNR